MIATPFQAASPCAATSYPRSDSSLPNSSANASSASLVSCRQTTSGCRSSNHGSSRGTRCLTELTFHVAMRTGFHGTRLCALPGLRFACEHPQPQAHEATERRGDAGDHEHGGLEEARRPRDQVVEHCERAAGESERDQEDQSAEDVLAEQAVATAHAEGEAPVRGGVAD